MRGGVIKLHLKTIRCAFLLTSPVRGATEGVVMTRYYHLQHNLYNYSYKEQSRDTAMKYSMTVVGGHPTPSRGSRLGRLGQ